MQKLVFKTPKLLSPAFCLQGLGWISHKKSLHPLKKSQRLLSQKIDNAQFPLTYSAFLIVLFFQYMCCIVVPFLMTIMMNKKQLRHQTGFSIHFKSLLAKKPVRHNGPTFSQSREMLNGNNSTTLVVGGSVFLVTTLSSNGTGG